MASSQLACKGDNGRVMTGADFAGAARQQAGGVAPGQHEFAQPLQADKADEIERRDQHQEKRMGRMEAEKPGPRAVISMVPVGALASTRSSTNSTAGADILPKSRSTARS